jgi:flagellar protein FliO/FliZ
MSPSPVSIVTALIALVAVLALIWLVGRAAHLGGLARRTGTRTGKRLAVSESLAIDPRRKLLLARCDGREVLLLTGGGQDIVVGWLPAPERAA